LVLLVTGADGQLGNALRDLVPDARYANRRDLDISSYAEIAAFDWSEIDGIVNAAAWTAVDDAEYDPQRAWATNATGVALLAERARKTDIPFVQVSSDYVFGITPPTPIPITAPLRPINCYGITKAAGELAAQLAPRWLIVRTSWVYGDGRNFVRRVRGLAERYGEVNVVDDQFGRPTHAGDLAAAILSLLGSKQQGFVHAAGGGDVVSWADIAEFILDGTGRKVNRVPTSANPGFAKRQPYSALKNSESVEKTMRHWRVALAGYLTNETVT